MRVAVIAPPYPLEECPAPPLGVTYVAAAFEAAGVDVKIIDYIISKYSREKLIRELDSFRPHIVGVTSVTMNFPVAVDIVRAVKVYDESILTVMGGPHVSFAAFSALSANPEIDVVVTGEGERTIPELATCVAKKSGLGNVRGIVYRHNGAIVNTGWREFIDDLDTLPLPARHLLPLSRYQALGYPISIITGRGCPYSCIFCLGRRMVGKKVRQRSAPLIVDEIEQILSYGLNRINIADDLFTSSKKKVKEVCREIHERGLRFAWSAFARVDTVDGEMLELMRDTGCDSISFGVESGNREMLKRIKKGISLDGVRRAVKLCKEVGITAHASFMVGLPGESHETLSDTREFAESLGIMYGYHFFSPFPGTEARESVGRYDLEILMNDWCRYDANSAVVSTSKLSPEEMNEFVASFDKEMQGLWEEKVKGYREGTNLPEDDLRVKGHFRTQLVYKLLSEDLIEDSGEVPADTPHCPLGEAFGALVRRIVERTGADENLVHETIKSFAVSGYIKSREIGGRTVWYWTHNNRTD
ncbi:MAG: radical SAM protein [Deltaproteobacteria bacterium]|nr:radical SAM protein [Deltaproteobacteria bacterium]